MGELILERYLVKLRIKAHVSRKQTCGGDVGMYIPQMGWASIKEFFLGRYSCVDFAHRRGCRTVWVWAETIDVAAVQFGCGRDDRRGCRTVWVVR